MQAPHAVPLFPTSVQYMGQGRKLADKVFLKLEADYLNLYFYDSVGQVLASNKVTVDTVYSLLLHSYRTKLKGTIYRTFNTTF